MRYGAKIISSILVLLPTAVAGLLIMRTRPDFAESATVLFSMPFKESAAVYTLRADSLIATGSVISQIVMSGRTRDRIAAAGGTASYDVALVNLFNQDYPDFSYPEATLTVTSPDPAATQRTYLVVKHTLTAVLARWQRQAGARPAGAIRARFIDDSGLVVQKGSRKRALAGLLAIALLAYGTTVSVITRVTTSRRGQGRRGQGRRGR